MLLRPARDGLLVRDPTTGIPLPAAGAECTLTGPAGRYWRRRLRDGDVIEVTEEEAPKAPKRRGGARKPAEGEGD